MPKNVRGRWFSTLKGHKSTKRGIFDALKFLKNNLDIFLELPWF